MRIRYTGDSKGAVRVESKRPVGLGEHAVVVNHVWSARNGWVVDVPDWVGDGLLENAGDCFERVEGERVPFVVG